MRYTCCHSAARCVALGTNHGYIYLFELLEPEDPASYGTADGELRFLKSLSYPDVLKDISSLALSPDGKAIGLGSSTGACVVAHVELSSMKKVEKIFTIVRGHDAPVTALTWTAKSGCGAERGRLCPHNPNPNPETPTLFPEL